MVALGLLFLTFALVVLAWSCPRFQTRRTDLYRTSDHVRDECSHVRILRRHAPPYDQDAPTG